MTSLRLEDVTTHDMTDAAADQLGAERIVAGGLSGGIGNDGFELKVILAGAVDLVEGQQGSIRHGARDNAIGPTVRKDDSYAISRVAHA